MKPIKDLQILLKTCFFPIAKAQYEFIIMERFKNKGKQKEKRSYNFTTKR